MCWNHNNKCCVNCCIADQWIYPFPGPTGPTGSSGPTGPTGATGTAEPNPYELYVQADAATDGDGSQKNHFKPLNRRWLQHFPVA